MAKTRLIFPCILLPSLELRKEGKREIVTAINGTKYSLTIIVQALMREKSRHDCRLLFLQMSKVTKIGVRKDEVETLRGAVLCHSI
jgi:hypothetical protein